MSESHSGCVKTPVGGVLQELNSLLCRSFWRCEDSSLSYLQTCGENSTFQKSLRVFTRPRPEPDSRLAGILPPFQGYLGHATAVCLSILWSPATCPACCRPLEPRLLMLRGLDQISEDRLFPQRPAGLQPVQALHQDEALAASSWAHPYREPVPFVMLGRGSLRIFCYPINEAGANFVSAFPGGPA